MYAYAIATFISLLVYFVVGNYAGRRIKHLDDSVVAGRRAITLLIVGTLIASMVGTNSFLGQTCQVYSGCAAALIFQIPIETRTGFQI